MVPSSMEQPLNAALPIVLRPSLSVIAVRNLHSANELSPIVLTVSGNVTLSTAVPPKAP